MTSAHPPEPVLSIEGLGVRYGRAAVLDEVRLRVARGSVYALLGRNGAGKSTLVRCLLGQLKPTRGAVRLFGRDAWTHRAWAMERVGVVPEEPDAPPAMTASEIFRFARRLYARWDEEATRERLRRFATPLDVPFKRLSKGQKGAVMLSLALASTPELLVLDDPTLGLDVIARDAVFGEVIGDLADRGTTIFVTTHDLAAIERLADRVGILENGRLVLEEDIEALKGRWTAPLEEIFVTVAGAGKGTPA
jgi:ABC-2 type transport system ATP-binding protein